MRSLELTFAMNNFHKFTPVNEIKEINEINEVNVSHMI